ncbi:MAG: hypothetical protein CVV44_00500 [Spirochaetae bacterium HGW-Spirochaetae-1]|jgi:TolB protein|nr:MAG: hypothetical protein CVV44_00500 [Spirochaetae bacterium HGW-Spirochaetae-1]
MKKLSFLIFIYTILFPFIITCENKKGDEVSFSYKAIMDKEFRYDVGEVIPVTVERSIETEGDISPDGDYLYYASNRENGNFDIYLRELDGITTVRLTHHASKDSEPVVSPDGKRVAFVSNREDPEGDIYLIKLDAKNIINKAKQSVSRLPSQDSSARNLTQIQDPSAGTILISRDAGPCWSPNGKFIVFSSKRDGIENIWLMEDDGDRPRKITEKGGVYPRFSADGKDVIFISYRDDNPGGDIYSVHLETGKEKKLITSRGIVLFPSYLADTDEIIYTLIDRDTNGNGSIDLKDNAVLQYHNTRTGEEYPLTLYTQSSFNARWLPIKVFKSKTYDAILLYSNQQGDNINLNIIPENGIIPKKGDSYSQYTLAQRYREEFQDEGKYLLALERVHQFFRNQKDMNARIYSARALALLVGESRETAAKERYLGLLKKMSSDGDPYISALHAMAKNRVQGKSTLSVLHDAIKRIEKNNNEKRYMPYLLEELGTEELAWGEKSSAVSAYDRIIREYPSYKGIESVHFRKAFLENDRMQDTLSPSTLYILTSGSSYNRVQLTKYLVSLYEKEKNTAHKDGILRKLLSTHDQTPQLKSFFNYTLAVTAMQRNRNEEAEKYLKETLKSTRNIELLFYRSQILLGELALRQKHFREAEIYFATAARGYLFLWHEPDYRDRLKWLINFYEEYGQRAESSGDFSGAVELYDKYATLMSVVHRKRAFDDLYDEYGPRAHIYYINASTQLKKDEGIRELEKKYSDGLTKARMDFDKAHLYGLGYIYTLKALQQEYKKQVKNPQEAVGLQALLANFSEAIAHIDWAVFIDDTFIESHILKSWIYQYVDLRRSEDKGENERLFNRYFPSFLWEKNISILELALDINNETIHGEKEGNIHLNMANNYFLLNNYPEALNHYAMTQKYKTSFNSKIEEALFYFHLGYCYWQNDEIEKGRREIRKSLFIYESLSQGSNISRYKNQLITLYKYYALFFRWEENYGEAIDWYQKILSFASKYRIRIDRARYLQEIAQCHRESGDYDSAIRYLEQASLLLNRYPDDEQTYKFQFRFFDIIPFSFYDLGLDNAVIGESKFFTKLDTRSKRLLNLSLLESIHADTGNYGKAAQFLEKKIKYLEKRDTQVDLESLITTHNNLGYYSFKSGNYMQSREHFENAWKLAMKTGSPEGALTSILNLTTLFAFSIENKPGLIQNPLKDADAMIDRITSYRQGYENNLYTIRYDELSKEAKSQNRKILKSEEDALREEISRESRQTYYRLDVARGILLFYKAELTRMNLLTGATDDAYKIYKNHEGLFSIYNEALSAFQSSREEAENRQNPGLQVKLLLNAAVCYTRMGAYDKAYAMYSDAVTLADSRQSILLQFSTYLETARFLKEQGRSVEGDDFLTVAADYYEKALSLVEKYPVFYSDSLSKIENLYDSLAEIYIQAGKWKNAFHLSERQYAAVKIIVINRLSPDFSDKNDVRAYHRYQKILAEIRRSMNEISSQDENLDEGVRALQTKNLESRKNELDTFTRNLRKDRPLLASYLSMHNSESLPDKSVQAVSFFLAKNKLHAWIIKEGTITFTTIGANTGDSADLASRITAFLEKTGGGKNIYVVFNQSIMRILRESSPAPRFPRCTFVPSVNSIAYCRREQDRPLYNVFYTGTGLAGHLSSKSLPVTEYKKEPVDYTPFSLLVDEGENELFTPAILFNTKLKPALIIKNIQDLGYESIISFFEASLYADIPSTIITLRSGQSDLAATIRLVAGGGFPSLADRAETGLVVLPFGHFIGGKGIVLNEKEKLKKAAEAMEKHDHYVSAGSYELARIELNRWHELSRKDTETEIRYACDGAILHLLQGDIVKASDLVKNVLSSFSGDAVPTEPLLILKIYLDLYQGDIASASQVLQNNPRLRTYAETGIFDAIIEAAAGSLDKSLKLYRELESSDNADSPEMDGHKQVLPMGRLQLLFAEYLLMLEGRDTARSILKNRQGDFPMSDRETISYGFLGGSKNSIAGQSERAAGIVNTGDELLTNEKISPRRLLEYSVSLGGFDRLTAPAWTVLLEQSRHRNLESDIMSSLENMDIDSLWGNTSRLDAILLLKTLSRLYTGAGEPTHAIEIIDSLLARLQDRGNINLTKELMLNRGNILARQGLYSDAYKNTLELEQMTGRDERFFQEIQILLLECETRLVQKERAENRISELLLDKTLSGVHAFTLLLLQTRLELNRLATLKTATAEEGRLFEQLFQTAMDRLDSDPGLYGSITSVDLLEEVIDEYINYKMKTGNRTDALLYSDMKKHISARLKYAATTGQLKTIRSLPFVEIQKKIPSDAVLICITKNKKDIFAWILTKTAKNTEIIKDVIPGLTDELARYKENLLSLQNTANTSLALDRIFTSLKKYYKDKKTIIFITDEFMEQVPFEIMGEKNFLVETHGVYFLPSLATALKNISPNVRSVEIIGRSRDKIFTGVEEIALRESGLPLSSGIATGSIAHLFDPVLYNQDERILYCEDTNFGEIAKRSTSLYLPFLDLTGSGPGIFSLTNSQLGINFIIFNNSTVHDNNNAWFINSLYAQLARGGDIRISFEKAIQSLKDKKEFRHPAYWWGIRLYCNGL